MRNDKSSKVVRDGYWYVDETIIEQLEKPGLTSNERTYLAAKLRENRKNWREWEEQNEGLNFKLFKRIDIPYAFGVCVGVFVTGIGLAVAIRKVI